MKKIYPQKLHRIFISIILILICFSAHGQTINTDSINGPFCAGAAVSISYTTTGTFVSGNLFTAQLSTASGSFLGPVTIGTLSSTTSGTISATIPVNAVAGTKYRIRVISSNPSVVGSNNGIDIVINPLPSQPAAINTLGGAVQVCPGDQKTYYITNVAGATSYTWTSASAGGTITNHRSSANADSIDVLYNSNLGASYLLSVLANDSCGSAPARTLTIYKTTPPAGPGAISGPVTGACAGTTVTYSVPSVSGVTYNWFFTTVVDAVINQTGTNSITVNFGPTWSSGKLSVTGSYRPGCDLSTTTTLSIISKPSTPVSIITLGGNAQVCPGDVKTYYITDVVGATGYTWSTLSPGGTILNHRSGLSADSIDVLYDSNLGSSFTLYVTADNLCGSGSAKSFSINKNSPPASPGAIGGPVTGACAGTTVTYSVPSVSGVTYNWFFTTAVDAVINQNGSDSITVNFGPTWSSGKLSVTASYRPGCDVSTARTISIVSIAGSPVSIITLGGNAQVCPGDVKTYYIADVAGATGYTWSSPSPGGTILNQRASATADSIDVLYDSNLGSSFTLYVTADNACGSSPAKNFSVSRTIPPAAPGGINGPKAGACAGNTGVSYSVPFVSGVTYNWFFTTAVDAVINQNGSDSITINFGSTWSSGKLSVTGSYRPGCDLSSATTLSIASIAGIPLSVITLGGNTQVCPGDVKTYYIADVAGATGYTWSSPSPGGTISNQRASATADSIDVLYDSNLGSSFTLYVTADNACGSSPAKNFSVSRTIPPAAPGGISGPKIGACAGSTVTYSVPFVSGVTYNWFFTTEVDAVINQNGSDSITINFGSTWSSGKLSVTGSYRPGCDLSSATTLSIASIAGTPLSVIALGGNAQVCPGDVKTYYIADVAGATGYTWSSPSLGGTILNHRSSATADSIDVLYDSNLGSSFTLYVSANNLCGSSAVKNFSVTRTIPPGGPGAIIGPGAGVCEGSAATYSVPFVSGVTYNWFFTTAVDAVINQNGSDSITVNFGPTWSSGKLSVTASYRPGCDLSPATTLSIISKPGAPLSIITMGGNAPVCPGDMKTYYITNVTGATGYTWSSPSPGGTILNQRASATADSIDVLYDSNLGSSFSLNVSGSNSCGSSSNCNLTILKGTKSVTRATSCNSYIWPVNGQTYTASGTYTIVKSCYTDSLYLTINQCTTTVSTQSACDSYTWPVNGQTYTKSGAYAAIIGFNIDSLYLTITKSTDSITTVSTCNSYIWPVNGQTYTISGAYAVVTGCNTDSLYLTITPSMVDVTTDSGCDSYIWLANGQTYTSSGAYAEVTGCHTDSLYLTITTSTMNVTTDSACDSYTWSVNGQTYIASGSYAVVTGCHTDSLYLTITSSTTEVTTDSACDSYTWSINGQIYTASGAYAEITGCNTDSLYLTITPSSMDVTTDSACDSYIWSVNGQTYTLSGAYAAVTGCHTDSLYLTITSSSTDVTTDSSCDSYIWPVNGLTYTASGGYAVITGCHTDSLYLTITQSTVYIAAASACESYTWLVNGQTYTTSGAYAEVTGCHTDSLYLTIKPDTLPTPDPIETLGGAIKVCPGDIQTYYVANVAGALGYTWTSSSTGGTLLNERSGATADSIDVLYDSTLAATFVLSITADNSCGSSLPGTLTIYKNIPPTPLSITGPSGACRGQSGVIFSVPFFSGALYHWTLPANATGSSDSSSISISFKSTYSGGTLSEYASNVCGNSGVVSGTVIRYTVKPAAPSAISGTTINVCANSNQVYTVAPVSNATGYIWTPPVNASIVSGQGTGSVTVNFNSGFVSGTFSVQASNCIGISGRKTFAVTTAVPATPTSISGATSVSCGLALTYSCTSSAGAVSYLWTLPAGCAFLLSGGGQGTRSIQVIFSPVYSTGIISVQAIGACGGASLMKNITVRSASPSQPGLITGTVYIACSDSNIYSIIPATGVSAYKWTPPAGCSINGNGAGLPVIILAPAGASVTLRASSGFRSGSLSVAAVNSCGIVGAARTLTIKSLIPAQPNAITGPTNFLCNSSNTYSIIAATGVDAYKWTPSAGCSINGNVAGVPVTILAPGGASVTVTAPSGFVSGLLSVAGLNTCGIAGTARALSIKSFAPAQPSAISGPANFLCSNSNTYSVSAVNGVNAYKWTPPAGCSINGNGAGVSVMILAPGGASVIVTAPSGFVSGLLSVAAVNTCGIVGATRALNIKSLAPAQPSVITGPANFLCNNSNTYSTIAVTGVEAYKWTPPAGCSINGNGAGLAVIIPAPGGASVAVTASSGFISGSLSVAAVNTCGIVGTARALTIRALLPAEPGVIIGDVSNVCNSSHTYGITPVTGVAAYEWTPPAACSINGNGAGVPVTILTPAGASVTLQAPSGFASGLLTVAAVNTCGTAGPVRSLTINGKPLAPTNVTPLTVCKNENNLLTVVPAIVGVTYTWTATYSFTGQDSSSINVSWGNSQGNVTVTAGNSCGISAALSKTIRVVTCNATRQEEEQSANNNLFNVYPNPTSGNLTVEFNSSSVDKYVMRVTDIAGRLIINTEAEAQEGINLQYIDLSSFAKGMYVVSIQKAEYTKQLKVIVE